MSRLELIGPDENALRVHTGMLSVSVECAGADITAQLRGTGGGDGFLDAAHAAKIELCDRSLAEAQTDIVRLQ